MTSEDGSLVVVFNGEIYNYPELRAELETKEFGFGRLPIRKRSYIFMHVTAARWYIVCEECLRSRFGTRSGAVCFSRAIPMGLSRYTPPMMVGLSALPRRSRHCLLAGVSHATGAGGDVGFYLFGSVPEPFTTYRDIRALPAGHTQWVDDAGPREPESFVNLAKIWLRKARPCTGDDLATLCVRLYPTACVRISLPMWKSASFYRRGLIPVRFLVSCGMQVSMTSALLRWHSKSFAELMRMRRRLQHLSPNRYGARHIVRRVGQREFLYDLPAILEAMDQPSIDGINTWFVSKAAREAGLKVAISGLGGDELLAGYPSFVDVPRWRRRFGPLAAVPGLDGWPGSSCAHSHRVLRRHGPKRLAAGVCGQLGGRVPFAPRTVPAARIERGDGARLCARGPSPAEAAASTRSEPVPDPGSDTARICVLESSHYMRNQLLRDADWAGMAHGIEIRVPLVDVTLLKSLAPAISKLAPGIGKAALAQAPSTPLPDAVVAAPKPGSACRRGPGWRRRPARKPSEGAREPKGFVSRRWSQVVLARAGNPAREAHAL